MSREDSHPLLSPTRPIPEAWSFLTTGPLLACPQRVRERVVNAHCPPARRRLNSGCFLHPAAGPFGGAVMRRAILSVVVGYAAMFAAIFLPFSGLYLLLGQELSFQPGSYDPSM